NDIIYTLDLEGNLVSLNKAGEQITGYSREELLNKSIVSLITPEYLEKMREMMERKLAGEARTSYELEILARDGRRLTLEVSSRLIYRDGQPFGVQGIARDITERKRAEEALREADQRAIIEYERLLERITGLSQALGTSRDLLTIFRALRDFALASVPSIGIFISLYDPQRNVRTAAYAWGDGEEVDVSKLPPMPITSAGPNSRAVRTGQVVITDDYMNATRGHPGVLIGPDNGLRPQSSLVAPMAVMGRIVGTIEVQSYEPSAYRDEHVTAMRMAANLAAVAIENVRLFEQESGARALAEESNRMKDEFLATVSHELRTPLTSIMGWSHMLASGTLDEATTIRARETIERNARAQAQIIDDILDVSRIITGKLHLNVEPVELITVIEAAINAVRPAAEAKAIQLETIIDSHTSLVSGDPNRLQQVIWNLLSNAVKFTPSGGRIQVRLQCDDSHVEIKVVDTGQGIREEFLPYVFDRFRQADSTTTRRHGGLGLGLAIVRYLVELHGGTVQAESAGEGRGATFTVKLPLKGALMRSKSAHGRVNTPAGNVESPDHQPALEGLHVLLVDDEPDALEMLTRILEQREVKVTAVATAGEAISAIERLKPDVLVSDIGMPDEDGYELIRKVRSLPSERARNIPAVALTAYARDEDRKRSLLAGYQTHLAKPVDPFNLMKVVASLAGRNEDADGNGKRE
ncbi:MAG TPA: ATP-binding protein, partial [Pyrinomonadaceae bacterium]|nr:ATP-binding protein [Pyrinomonadaceae bacterium]